MPLWWPFDIHHVVAACCVEKKTCLASQNTRVDNHVFCITGYARLQSKHKIEIEVSCSGSLIIMHKGWLSRDSLMEDFSRFDFEEFWFEKSVFIWMNNFGNYCSVNARNITALRCQR